jgi:hypothetical protein
MGYTRYWQSIFCAANFGVKSIQPAVSDIIAAEIKKHQDNWKRGISFKEV